MDTPHCYKCRITVDLSLKRTRRGIKTFICRPCRREQMAQYKARKEASVENTDTTPAQWAKWAQESRMRIIEHYNQRQTA